MSGPESLREALRQSEERFALLVDSVVDYGIFMLDTEGRIASWNQGAERIKGYSEEDVLGRHFSLFYTSEDRDRRYPDYELTVAAREGRFEDEGWRIRKDGTRFWANVVITALRDDQGRLVGYGKVTRDLTDRRQAEAEREALLREREARQAAEQLSEEIRSQATHLERQAAELEALNEELSGSRARLRAIIDSSLDAVVTTDERSVILDWSRHAETLFGWSAEEAVGRTLAETIIPPQHREGHRQGVERYLETGEGPILNQRVEITALRRDGREFPVELTIAAAGWGDRVLFTAFIRDLTARKRFERHRDAEHAVTRVLAECHSLEEAAPRVLAAMGATLSWDLGSFWTVDHDAAVLRCVALWSAPGVDASELARATRQSTLAPGAGLPGHVWEQKRPVWVENAEEDGSFARGAAAGRAGLHGAFGFPLFAGDRFAGVVEFFHREALEPDEALLESLEVIGHDIAQAIQRIQAESERDRLLAEVHETAAERDAVLRQITDGVIFVDPGGRIAFVNEAARRMHGVAGLGESLDDRGGEYRLVTTEGEPLAPEDLPLSRALRRDETVLDTEWCIQRPDGTEVVARGSATPVVDEHGRKIGAVLTMRDVTEEQRLRREIEIERARLREVFSQAPALISMTRGPEHRMVLANPAYQRMAGRGELVGRRLREIFPELEGQGFFEMRDRVYATGEPHAQTEARLLADLDGDGVPEELFINFLTQPLSEADGTIGGILSFGVDVTEQVQSRRKVEEQAAEMEAQAEELQNQAMQLEEAQAELEMSNDELQRANEELAAKQAEAERARAEAEAANRAKSDFLATMSHELRTPINAIMGYGDLLAMGVPDPVTDAQRAQLVRIRASSEHLLMLIEDILDLAKIEAGRIEVAQEHTSAHKPIEAALSLLGPAAGEGGIELANRCNPETDTAFLGDEDRVRQILVNLLSNAVKFTEAGGSVSVRCEPVEGAVPGQRVPDPGPWICVHVEDTGIGIAPERLESVFDPFIQVESGTTRTRGGTGLGLTISRRLARLMDGDLTLESERGRGTRATLWLRAAPRGEEGRDPDPT